MRFEWLCVVLTLGCIGCAQQHGGQGEQPYPDNTPHHDDYRGPSWPDAGISLAPSDAGVLWGPLLGVPFDASGLLWDAGLLLSDASFPIFDATINPSVLEVNPVGPCPQERPPGSASGCRDWPWHSPACYRAPTECPALWESQYCITISGNNIAYVGLDSGSVCQNLHAYLPSLPGYGSLAQVGADLLMCLEGVVTKVSLADGSFETAPLACSAVFSVHDQLVVHEPISGSLSRYASWHEAKRGEGSVLAFATPGAMFAANSQTMAALWDDGNMVSMLAIDGSVTKRIFLEDFPGGATGMDLSDDDRLYVTTFDQVGVYDANTGQQLRMLPAPYATGLLCQPGLNTLPAGPNRAGAPRPGAEHPERSEYIVDIPSCMDRQVGPRYVAEHGGPELLVIANNWGPNPSVLDQRGTPHTLLLTSNEQATWEILITPQSKIQRLIISGDETPIVNVTGFPEAAIEYRTGRASFGGAGRSLPGYDETMLRAHIEEYLAQPITELAVCPYGGSFVVRDAPLPLCVQ